MAVSVTADQLFLYDAAVYTGTAGATATATVGAIREDTPVVINHDAPGSGPVRIQGEKLPWRHTQIGRATSISIPCAQMAEELMEFFLGLTAVSNVVTEGNAADADLCPQKSLAIVGTDVSGTTIRYDAPYGSFNPVGAITLGQAEEGVIPLEFRPESGTPGTDAHKPFYTFADYSATIATGTLTITKSIAKVIGESTTTDDLTDISFAAAPVGTIIRLQPAVISYAITIKDTGGLTLLGTAVETCVLGGQVLAGYNDFQKTGTGLFTEVRRYDPV